MATFIYIHISLKLLEQLLFQGFINTVSVQFLSVAFFYLSFSLNIFNTTHAAYPTVFQSTSPKTDGLPLGF